MIKTATRYHDKTSYRRETLGGHGLDWENQPSPYKQYPGEILELPQPDTIPDVRLSSLLRSPETSQTILRPLTVRDLAGIIRLTYSLTAKARYPGGDMFYRCVASAGALYPTELYCAVSEVEGLKDGLYHVSVGRFGLSLLQSGDLRPEIGSCLVPPAMGMPRVQFLLSAIFFRSAWKYRDRSYRYHLLDTGHVVEHMLLALCAFALPASCTFDFQDERINRLLGFDQEKEVCLAVSHGAEHSRQEKIPEAFAQRDASYQAPSTVAVREVRYPPVLEAHAAGFEIRSTPPASFSAQVFRGAGISRRPLETVEEWPEVMSYGESVLHRRSRRNFIPEDLGEAQSAALLESVCRPGFEDHVGLGVYNQSITTGFLAGPGASLEPGFYLFDADGCSMMLVKQGDFLRSMAHICLDQMWLAGAAFHVVFLADLKRLEATWGPRGYRYAMLSAGRLGSRLYLAATALGLGCCGIGAFFDYEARELLGLAQNSRMLYLVAVGKVKGASPGEDRSA